MARRTYNREPLSFSTNSRDYAQQSIWSQAQFKGLCDDKNDSTIDQLTFTSVNNLLVDDDGLLISRPPLKREEGIGIIEEWRFGKYTLRLISSNENEYHLSCKSEDGSERIKIFRSSSPVSVQCTQIEDKIFIWINCEEPQFICFVNNRFEDARKYIYVPVTEQIINGLSYDLEDKNFLTNSYRKRYQYSMMSKVDFSSLLDTPLEVSYNNNKLYDTVLQTAERNLLLHPKNYVGNNFVDMARPNKDINVVLRYSKRDNRIDIGFGSNVYRTLPRLDGIISEPVLTRDGLSVIAFLKDRIMQCKLVLQETTDNDNTVLQWTTHSIYEPETVINNGETTTKDIETNKIIGSVFLTDDMYAYILSVDGRSRLTCSFPVGTAGIKRYTCYTHSKVNGETVYFNISGVDMDMYYTAEEYSAVGLCIYYRYFAYDKTTLSGMVSPGINFIVIEAKNSEKITDMSALSLKHTNPIPYPGDSYLRIDSFNYKKKDGYISSYNMTYTYVGHYVDFYYGNDGYEYHSKPYLISMTNSANIYRNSLNDYAGIVETKSNSSINGWRRYVIAYNYNDILTERDYYLDGREIYLPIHSNHYNTYNDDRFVENGDVIKITLGEYEHIGYIHRVEGSTTEQFSLSSESITDGCLVSFSSKNDEESYLAGATTINDDGNIGRGISNIYKIHLARIVENGAIEYVYGFDRIKNTDLIVLKSYYGYTLEKDNMANPFYGFADLRVGQRQYKSISSHLNIQPPVLNIRGDDITYGDIVLNNRIEITGYINITKDIQPLYITDEIIYRIDDTIWSTQLSDSDTFSIDKYFDTSIRYNINADKSLSVTNNIDVILDTPTHINNLGEYCLSFVKDGKNYLEITSARRIDNEYYLYLPKINEQEFLNRISNIHPLSENSIAIFTEYDIWYVNKMTLEDGSVYYTKAVRSKIPNGCRDGDDIITALDGKAVIFPTQRGITAMAPEQFIATNEPTLSYLSDAIQDKYYHFYNDKVKYYNGDYLPNIKICTYRHWMLFYKYMDREVLVLDTRGGTWWLWSVPYPIMDITVDSRLHFLLNVRGLHFDNKGMRFLWADKESKMYLDTEGNFPELTDTDFVYKDDILSDSLSGDYVEYYENEYVGTRKVLKYASPIIKWHFVSPKLHFGAINNYKSIKGITLNVKGKEVMTSKLYTKAFRDVIHPEKSETMEININDLRTFVKPLNLMHVTNFQYRLDNDANNDAQYQLKLNILCIKYEIKEGIR